jgi:hypothetical protein
MRAGEDAADRTQDEVIVIDDEDPAGGGGGVVSDLAENATDDNSGARGA